MSRFRILPYRSGSKGVKALKKALVEIYGGSINPLIIRRNGSVFEPEEGDIIVNWGRYRCPYPDSLTFNSTEAVRVAHSKMNTFLALDAQSVRIPSYTIEYGEALRWYRNGTSLYCRTLDSGQGGAGIVIVSSDIGNAIPSECPLYTAAVPAVKEFRVHVFQGHKIDVQEKRPRRGVDADPTIRSHDNGWVFCRLGPDREELHVPEDVIQQAMGAVNACGLDFGAVDIGVTEEGLAYVYEVNTAPGLTHSTAKAYARAMGNALGLEEGGPVDDEDEVTVERPQYLGAAPFVTYRDDLSDYW